MKPLAEQKVTIILITSTSLNFIGDAADVTFLADRGSADLLQSVTAAFSLGHALVIAIAAKLGSRSVTFLNAIDAMEEDTLAPKPNGLANKYDR
jgi:DNA-binding MurR/RpiR family transcriptional regulator